MSRYTEKALALRAIAEPHYNCAQAVLLAFSDLIGLPEETLYTVGANFGGGMKTGGTCGAITGGLMTLGLLGITKRETVQQFQADFRAGHDDMSDCSALLAALEASGGEKAPHCNGLICEVISKIEGMIG